MAIYHLSVKPVSRGGGRSATAAAAYRAAERVHDVTTGQDFDYTHKLGVAHTEIVLPTAAAELDVNWARDRQQLWNAAEQAENRSNSRVAREYEIALPQELTRAQRVALTREFALEIADRHGVAVDVAIHAPHWAGDQRNWHAHLLATTRTIEPHGLGEKATIEWSDANRQKAGMEAAKHEIKAIRERWAELTNEHLRELGLEMRVDHRSLKAQGLEREPTSHKGPAVMGMERRGIETEVGQRMGWEQQAAAQRRLEAAHELGQLEREGQQLQQSIVMLSADLATAVRQREAQQPRYSAAISMEEARRAGREQWWALRQEQLQREKEHALKQSPEKVLASDHSLAPEMTMEERQQRAAERWLEYDRIRTLEKERSLEGPPGPELSPEKTLERDTELTRKRDGYDFDFEM